MVDRGSQTESQSHAGRGGTERDLVNDIVSFCAQKVALPAMNRRGERSKSYQISKRVKFLAHKARLFPPASNLSIHKVEE